MSQDNKVIGFMAPGELAALMRETGRITVEGTATLDGKPVIQASLKVMNSHTGEELAGGLPFAVVLFKGAGEPGYTNIAIGTSVPTAQLGITLPPDFFNTCNQSYRFIRAYALDRTSFVLQMDLFLRHATREYVKFGFGLWAAGFSQILFDLFGRHEGEGFAPAAGAYAASQESVLSRYAAAVAVAAPAAEVEAPSAGQGDADAASEPEITEPPAELREEPFLAESAVPAAASLPEEPFAAANAMPEAAPPEEPAVTIVEQVWQEPAERDPTSA